MTVTRRSVLFLIGVAALAASYLPARAQTNQQPPRAAHIEKYSATTVNLKRGDGEPLSIRVSRWSTDTEREHITKLLVDKGKGGDEEMQYPLGVAPTLGYIWTSEATGYSLRYAVRLRTPDGGERIILATDRRLGALSREPWQASRADVPEYEYTLLELRLNGRGIGEGKMSLGAKVGVDQTAMTMALEDYAAAPVLLKDVKRVGPGSALPSTRPATSKK